MELPKYFYFRVRPKDKGTAVDLEDASDADVVEVVRCKDCKYYKGLAECNVIGECMGIYGYCAWGERRED